MRALPSHPDTVLVNGRIYTVDPDLPWAQALAIREGRILALGTDPEIRGLAGPRTRIIDVGGRLVLPGLWDAHIHFLPWALGRQRVQLADTRSKAEMLARIQARAQETPPGRWLLGHGWNESFWGETEFPTREDLDPVTGTDRPACFTRSDMHCAVVNTAALQAAGITGETPDPPGGVIDRDPRGEPTGVLREQAMDLVFRHVPRPTDAEVEAAMRAGMAELHRLGVTGIHDQRSGNGTEGRRALAAFQQLRQEGDLRLRVACNLFYRDLEHVEALGLRTGLGDAVLRLGHVKLFTDGSLGSRTAWMMEPFLPQPGEPADNRGVNVTPVEEMAAAFRRATVQGFPISVHAIGDQANRVCLDLFEELASVGLQPPVPHRIEHAQTLHPDDLPRFGQLGLTASVQPIHCTDDMDTADLLLGQRGRRMYRFRSLHAAGALLAFGSDAPVSDPNPFLGFHAALYRQRPERMERPAWYPEECLDLPTVIQAYTLGPAQAVGWQALLGSLAPGKRADLIVLDRDLFALAARNVRDDAIARTEVLLTLFDGQVVWADPRTGWSG